MKIKIIAALVVLIPLAGFSQNDIAIQNYLKGEYSAALNGLTTLSQNNNNEATFDLGQMYLYGQGVTKDTAKGYQLIQQAANRNYIPAQIFLAKNDLIEKNNMVGALNWFQKAANLGNVEAQMFVATSYLYGYGVPQDVEKARKIIIKAAQNGDPLAQYELAKIFSKNKSPKDQALANVWLAKSAEKGNAQAQYQLGMTLLTGTQNPQNIPKAVDLLTQAAEQQNKNAGFALFSYFLNSSDSTENFIKTIHWLDNTAQLIATTEINNDATALLYFMKPLQGINAKAPATFSDWMKLAKLGDINAAQQVGFRYFIGDGVAENQDAAIKWLAKAAINNNYIAKIQLESAQSRWENQDALKEPTVYTPKLAEIDRTEIFDENYQLNDPSTLPTTEIIQTLGRLNYNKLNEKITLPKSRFNATEKALAALESKETLREAYQGYFVAQYRAGMLYQQGIAVKKDVQEAIKWYQLSAGQNYSNAEYALGMLAFTGNGMKQDYKVALDWFTKAAFKGNVNAQLFLARLYEFGYGEPNSENYIEKNLKLAKIMYGLAAANNNAEAQYNLAQLYISGLLDPDDYQKQTNYLKQAYVLFKEASTRIPNAKLALAFFYTNKSAPENKQEWAFSIAKQFAESGNDQANILLALMYDRGIGTEEDTSKAMDIYKKEVEASNPIALYILGSKFGLGEDVTKSAPLAREYLNRAAAFNMGFANYNLAVLDYQQDDTKSFINLLKLAKEQGYQPASVLLADYYLTHQSDSEDTKQAIATYESLANAGNIDAQIKLAFMYQHGIYFDINYETALAWYQKAAENNNALAQFALGEMYQVGQGTDRDLALATEWYSKAAQQQFAPAQVALGFIDDVDNQNYPQARMWYELAAQNGHNPIAAYNLALMYEYGKGMPVDMKKAKALYQQVVNKFQTADLDGQPSS